MPSWICSWFAAAAVMTSFSVAWGEEVLTYEQHIRPIFRAHCFDCHGATAEMQGGLDLRLVRLLQRGGESGPAIVPHQPQQSYLLERLRSGDMPPGEKKVSTAEIDTIERWIAAGAATARPEPDTIGEGLGITPEERSFWSFQPIQRPSVPDLATFAPQARVRTPIDALLLRGMPERSPETGGAPEPGSFPPDADRRVLVLRASFTLTGLPPDPEVLRKWLSDPGEDWYDRMLTELLASPHYGERWARHWLDVAGYSDSDGYSVDDPVRGWAWKYRDWVIRAFNQDKPFDQFLVEQLAGDELAGPPAGDWTPAQIDLLTATGFLRMAADGTGSGADHPEARNQTVADTLKIVGTSLLGLSLQCAQCHDHRYDPIPQTDYFALRAVFEPALDWQAWKVPEARLVSLLTAADRQKGEEIEAEAQKIAAEKATRLAEYMQQALDQELQKYAEPLRTSLREAYQNPADKRTNEQKKLLEMHPSINITPGTLYQYIADSKPKLEEFDRKIQEVRAKKPPADFLHALVEPANHVPETKLFFRGDHRQPKQTIAPAGLTVTAPEGERRQFPLDDPAIPSTGRRLAFARWLTSGEHPLVARVMVNRVWMHHFGTGLVATPADFGRLGAAPSHPELLDWLAAEFMAQGWSLKKLHRTILTSTVWRSERPRDLSAADFAFQTSLPNAALRRLEAEAIRDRMLAVTGQLDRTLFGKPLAIKEDETGQVIVESGQSRRSLYIQMRRSRPVAMLQAFDAPVMETNCESRPSSTVATQALMLLNGELILEQAAHLADRTLLEAQALPSDRIASLEFEKLPRLPGSEWQYGYGSWDSTRSPTVAFNPLTHWTGSQWQAGSQLPDPQLGYVLLHAGGGHPDVAERSVIRRWTAPAAGTVQISGKLVHGSAPGDGVRGRIEASRTGMAGEWPVYNGEAVTAVASLEVQAGDHIDFIVDCRENVASDSFTWPVSLTLAVPGQPDQLFSSEKQFRGPGESLESLAGKIQRAWQLAYCREPDRDELRLALDFVVDQLHTLPNVAQAVPNGRTPLHQALTNLCQSLLSSNEFLYVE